MLADRTQAPSGAGYALENRIVLSRMLPERVPRVPACSGWRASSARCATRCRRWRRADATTRASCCSRPGPYNETYFEHAYLARYLGYTLVEGGDLTVRDDRVFLKTLGGLQPVDVILRRLDDDFCDPLELRGDSSLGVAGLVQAVRAGNVVVANALGSGLLETPALMAFLPGLCRALLGEELTLPSVATWWCGAASASCAYVLEQPRRAGHQAGVPGAGTQPVFGARSRRARGRDELSRADPRRGRTTSSAQERRRALDRAGAATTAARSRGRSCCAPIVARERRRLSR